MAEASAAGSRVAEGAVARVATEASWVTETLAGAEVLRGGEAEGEATVAGRRHREELPMQSKGSR